MNKLRRVSMRIIKPLSPMTLSPSDIEHEPAISALAVPLGSSAQTEAHTLPPEGDHVLDVMVSGRSRDGGLRMDLKRHATRLGADTAAASEVAIGANSRLPVSEDTLRVGDSNTAEIAEEAHRVHDEEANRDLSRNDNVESERPPVPPLSIVIMVAGTRGDKAA